MPLSVDFSNTYSYWGLMRARIADGVGNVYEKIMTADEVSVVLHYNAVLCFNGVVPQHVTLFEHDLLVDRNTVLRDWILFLEEECKKGPSMFSDLQRKDYQEKYDLLKARNKWTDEWLSTFTQTEIYIEPIFSDD